MTYVATAESTATRWLGRGRRLAAARYTAVRYTPARYTAARYTAAAVLGLVSVLESVRLLAGTGAIGRYVLLVVLLGLATTVPVALRPPTAAAVAVTAAGVLSLIAFDRLTAAGLVAQILAAYRLGRGGWPSAAVLLGLPYLVLALTRDSAPVVVTLASLVPVAAVAGIAWRTNRDDARSRAAHDAIAGTLIEHTARGERARIARELHDVVAHHISMIAVQAETARLTTPGMSPAGAQRLSAIGDTARSALTEMRRLLGVLREDARADAADRRPQPGLRQLNELLDEARDATGAGTRLILRGAPVSLDPGVELAAYRIVQEALTNCRRHAPGAAVDVELHFTTGALRLLVRDNGPGPSTSDPLPGHGLLGMRERALAVGGELRTGSVGTSGFLVEATLPTDTGDDR
jgi:signal transduction histidine kinase